MKLLLPIVSGSLLALAAAADPTIAGRLLDAALATASAQQERDRGNDRDEKGRDDDEGKDKDRDRDEDRSGGKEDKDRDEERGGKDDDKDRDEDRGGKDDDKDADEGRGGGDEDRGQDEDRGGSNEHEDPGHGNEDKGPGHGNEDKDSGHGNEDKDPGHGNEDKDPGHGNDDGNTGPDVENPGNQGEVPDDATGGNNGGSPDSDIPGSRTDGAERNADDELHADRGGLASRFNLDDTETFDDDGFLARRGEIIALSGDEGLGERVEALGLRVVERQSLPSLDGTVYRLSVPPASSIDGILARLRAQDPAGVFDRNHLYDGSAAATTRVAGSTTSVASRVLVSMASGVSVGLIDTGIDVLHPALLGTHIELQYFVDESRPVPESHGTAVASLLVSPQTGVLPGAQLYVASVFYEDQRGGLLSEAQDLVRALDWLMERHVPVINMSLSGPPNEVLRVAISRALRAGHLIVAAVGNAGPASPPLYPAAYEGVIGVTAVDSEQKVYRRANRGAQVEFAALGVDVPAAGPGGLANYSGTSFASPYVAALLATEYRSLDSQQALVVREGLRSNAMDLGKPGRDEVYGFGLAQPRTISTAAR
jgi:hypothetical protein